MESFFNLFNYKIFRTIVVFIIILFITYTVHNSIQDFNWMSFTDGISYIRPIVTWVFLLYLAIKIIFPKSIFRYILPLIVWIIIMLYYYESYI